MIDNNEIVIATNKNLTKKQEEDKQSKIYLSHIYSQKRRPITDYPQKLSKELIFRNSLKPGDKLLDAGCGRGDMLNAFKGNGLIVEGVDLSEESVKLLHPIKIYQKNLENETIQDRENYYDIVFTKSLIEHLTSPLNFIKNCRNLIKDNGSLVVMTPSWVHHSFGPFYLDYTHTTPFTLHSLRDIGYLAGFSNVKVEYFYQLPFVWEKPFLTLIPKIISFLKLPYMPMYEQLTKVVFPEKINRLIRFSREVMLYAVMKK